MKKKNLIIFLFPNIWESSSWEALEVNKFRKIGDVVAYQLGQIINKQNTISFKKKFDNKLIKKEYSFFDWRKSFFNLLRKNKNKNILIINKVNPINFWSFLILRELSKIHHPIISFKNSGMPNINIKKKIIEKINIIFNLKYFFSALIKKFCYFLYNLLKFKNLKYLVSGHVQVIAKNKVIYGNSWDLNKIYLKNKRKFKINNYAVYVESSLALGGDKVIGPNSPKLRKQTWFRELNNFFNFIEKKFKLKVIIAAHPKNNHHNNKKNYYDNRKIYFNKTHELIKKSRLVFTERSSAINFVVKYKKPAFLIYNHDSISTSYNKQILENLSNELGITRISIGNDDKWEKLDMNVNEAKYKNFYLNYMNYKDSKISNFMILKKLYL